VIFHKYAAFNDGIPPSTGVTHLIREEEPGKWTIVATLPNQESWKTLVDQLNHAYDLADTTVDSTVREAVHDVAEAIRALPEPPVPPTPPKPPIGLMGVLTEMPFRSGP